jgi:acetoin utilization deacetylase AcuC-like enzyme
MELFYTSLMVNEEGMASSISKSPMKPKLVVEALLDGDYSSHINQRDVTPLNREDFYIAHTKEYVDAFFDGRDPLCSSNMLPWSKKLVDTVRYTNGSLFDAVEYAVTHPNSYCLSPTSGFHHAQPERGQGFCTFSGQIVASMNAYNKHDAIATYFDLDGHFGNSILDSAGFLPDSTNAIRYNLNPSGINESYLTNLEAGINQALGAFKYSNRNYVVWCHGADSHEDDDLVDTNRVNTECWLKASEMFYTKVKAMRDQGYNVPVVSCLFGGYRRDNYPFVIDLHRQDIEMGIRILET